MHKNYDILHELIESLQTLPHVICITETRIKNQPLSNLDLPNYSFVHVNSTTNARGAAMYITDNLIYKVCENQYQLCNSEALWFNSIDQSDTSFVIGVIYHHPSQILINTFIEDLSNCLTDYNKHSINYFILGDLNINTSPINRSLDAMHFINALLTCGAYPIIIKPTAVTDTTAKITNHLITNVTNHKILPGVIETSEVSDHYPVFCQVQNIMLPKKNNNFIGYYRGKSKFDSDAFNYDLFNVLNSYFMNLLNTTNNNFDVIFNEFTRIVLQIIDRHAPIKKFSRRQKKLLKEP